MKHMITLCLAVFFMAGTQNIQAQTKEETIQWLNDYGTKFNFHFYHDEINGANFHFKGFDGEFLNFLNVQYHNTSTLSEKYQVSPANILYENISTLNENKFTLKAIAGSIHYSSIAEGTTFKNLAVNNRTDSQIEVYFSSEDSKDAIRLINAIMNLAKLSGADELPKVTEDTF